MKSPQDISRDIDEIRSIMERSTKFPSLAGWAGIMAGLYALSGATAAYLFFGFRPVSASEVSIAASDLASVGLIAVAVLVLSVVSAVLFTKRKADKQGGTMWNTASRQLLTQMAVPMVSGGVLIIVLIGHGLPGLAVPLTLMFYGLALFSAGRYTVREIRFLGITQIVLGILSSAFLEYSLILWSVGFGVVHIVYGSLMYHRYDR
ncbi:MAG: hypothetical protein KBF97_04355 [Bacteroidetes bacterium]|nr:hypothetical protein [Bacteroidota bacterium]